MDQVKVILAAVKKHHFWVLGGIVLLVLLGVWWQSTVGLAKQYDTRKSEIDARFSDMASVASSADPPNEGVIKAIETVHGELTQEVLAAWEYLYEQQQKNNPLPNVLGSDFKIVWNSLGPADPIPVDYRDRYWNFIKDYFPRQQERLEILLPRVVEGEEGAGGGRAGAGRPGGGMMGEGMAGRGNTAVEYVGKVAWDDDNYKQLLSRFLWASRPNSQQVRMAQEDLWVYDTLLNIVKDLNQAARSHYNSPVKRIVAVDIGPEAAAAYNSARNSLGLDSLQAAAAQTPGATPGMGEMGLEMGGPPMGAPMEGPGMGMSGEGMGMGMPGEGMGMGMPGAGTSGLKLVGRYVNEDFQPVPVENGQPVQPYAEFKMMPVRLSLLMDQRKIPELIVKCANSKMPVEIRRLRLSPSEGSRTNFAAPRGMPGGNFGPGMGGGGEMMPGMGRGMGEMMGGGRGQGEGGVYQGPYDMPVEILGIIYIYNPPDKSKLATGTATTGAEAPPVAATPPATLPADETPAAVPAVAEPPAAVPPAAVPPAGTPPAAVPPAGVPPAGVPPAGVPPAGVPPAGVPPAAAPAGVGPAVPTPKPPVPPVANP